jgi:predicted deacylase
VSRSITRIRVGARRGVAITDLPVITHSAGPGPVVVVTANIHGDEVNGLHAVHQLDREIPARLVRGAVALYPCANPAGLLAGSRLVTSDGSDLNRLFPGAARGAWSGRLAAGLWKDIADRRPELLLDLHSDAPQAIPYAIVDRPVRLPHAARGALAGRLVRAGEASGLTSIREYGDEAYLRFQLDRSMAGAAVNVLGIPALTLEAGPRRWVDAASVSTLTRAVMNLLVAWGVCDGEVLPHPTRVAGVWRRGVVPRTRRAGLLRPVVSPGATYQRGEVLAVIRNLHGELEDEVIATETGIVLSWVETAWAEAGSVSGTVAVPDGGAL